MMNEFEQFEQDLRNLVPLRCEHLAEETFYQAGWAAARQFEAMRLQAVSSLRPQTSSPQTRWPLSGWYRHPVAIFSGAMGVGLMFFIAVLNGTTNRGNKEESVASIEIHEEKKIPEVANRAEVAILNSFDEAQTRLSVPRPTTGTLSQMVASFLPWPPSSKTEVSLMADSPSGALSRAAQQQWDSLLQSDRVTCRHSSETTPEVTETESRLLQVSPLRNGMMKELL